MYSTCVTALIGEDIDAVCQLATQQLGRPIIPVGAPGFLGSKNLGSRLAGEVLLNHVIGTRESIHTTPFDVNIIGEYNIAGELWQITDMLRQVGISLRASITGDGRFAHIQTAHHARASMVVCSRALMNVARGLLDRYNIPFFEGSFYGVSEIASALRHFDALFQGELSPRIETFIAVQEADVASRIKHLMPVLQGKKVMLYTGGVKSWAFISALHDLGMQVVATSNRKSTQDDVDRMKTLLGEDGVIFEDGGPQQIIRAMKKWHADILLAGGRNQYTAAKACLPFLDVNQERHRCYAGDEGFVNLASDLASELQSPVYDQLRAARNVFAGR